MPAIEAIFANYFVYAASLVVTILSALYVLRQKVTAYSYVRSLLVVVHALFCVVIILDGARNFISSDIFMAIYTIGNTTAVLIDVILLTLISLIIYRRPSGQGYLGVFNEIAKGGYQRFVFAGFLTYVLLVELYLVFASPYQIVELENIAGIKVVSTGFSMQYLLMLLVILLFFIAYPSSLLFSASRRVSDREVKRALVLLPIVWTGIGIDLLIFNGYLITVGIDAASIGYFLAAIAFGISAAIFRRASLLAGFFQAPIPTQQVQGGAPFSTLAGLPPESIDGRKMLIEIDSSSPYEGSIMSFVQEFLSKGNKVFILTSKASPIYNTTKRIEGIRFYILTNRVSYPRPGDKLNEILIPSNDSALLLDALDRTLESDPNGKIAIVVDSVSDLILSLGAEDCYAFIKQAMEILEEDRVTALFLMVKAAHDERIISLLKTLFSSHLSYSTEGLKVIKGA